MFRWKKAPSSNGDLEEKALGKEKSMKNQAKNITLSLTLLLFAMLALTPAANAAQIWTDQEDYGPDEVVYISGTGFDIYSVISVTIIGPEEWGTDQFDSLNSPWWVYWSFTEPDRLDIGYLKTKCEGTFYVTVTDGTNTATTTFTDAINISSVFTSNSGGTLKSNFMTTDNVYAVVVGGGSGATKTVRIYVVASPLPTQGGTLTDVSGSYETQTISLVGNNGPYLIWPANTSVGTYYVVVDDNQDGLRGNSERTYSFTVSAPVNIPPTAEANGPYDVDEGDSVTLSSAGSSDSDGSIVSYEWDFDYDGGTFNVDAIGASPTFSAAAIVGPASRTVALRVTDDDGDSDIDTTTVNILVASDTTPPDTQILTYPADPTNSDSASFTWTGSDNITLTANLVYSYQLDGGGWSSWASSTSTSYSSLADGPHTFEVKAKDEAGYEDLTPASWTWNIDATPPTVINIIVSDDLINEADDGDTFDVTVTFSEEMDTLATPTISFIPGMATTLIIPSGSWSIGNTVYTVSYTIADADVEESDVDVRVSGAQDLVGNPQDPDPTTVPDLFDVDTKAPTVTIDIPDYINIANVAAVPVTITSDEDGDYGYEISDGGVPITNIGSITGGTPVNLNLDLSSLAEGLITADALVEDAAGNIGYAPQDTATKDTIAPTGYITINGDLPYTNNVNVTLNLEATDASGIDEYRLADGTDATAGSPVSVGPSMDYDEDVPWTLPGGSGIKTVAVQYRDVAGNWSENYTDSIVLIDVLSAITAGGCPFDRDEGLDGQQFRLIFTQDPTNMSTYKLTASNPGQFFYNIFFVGTPGETANLSIDAPEPFVTQGAMPVHAYANVSFDSGCIIPADQIDVFAAQLDNDPDYDLAVSIPDTGLVYVRIHLDYGLKKDVGYTRDGSNNAEKPIGTDVILDLDDYVFAVSGSMSDAVVIQNENVFKKIPGFGGMVLDGLGDPVYPANVTITGPDGSTVVATDEDGFYYLYYKHKGKEATFTVECLGQSEKIAMKANKYVEVNFEI
jgi:hypothetical protein